MRGGGLERTVYYNPALFLASLDSSTSVLPLSLPLLPLLRRGGGEVVVVEEEGWLQYIIIVQPSS